MVDPNASTLRRLSHVGVTLANPADDVRGQRVIDAVGAAVGEVDDLYVDDREGRIRFLLVVAGGFPGPCEAEYLIPAEAVARVGDRAVHLCKSRGEVAAAPPYHAQLIDEDYLRALCRHYGVRPYWEAGPPDSKPPPPPAAPGPAPSSGDADTSGS